MEKKGTLLVLDGLDGSGKTTQLERLERRLAREGIPARIISFPDYSQPSSSLVTMYLRGEFGSRPEDVNAYAASSFYAVDRYASYKKFWEPDYREGKLIVSARYTTSNAIHQMGKLPREEWDGYLDWLCRYEYDLLGLPRPDRVIFLDLDPDQLDRLIGGRYGDQQQRRDIHENRAYLAQCRQSALYAAKRLGFSLVPCHDGERIFSREEVEERIWALVAPLLP